MQRHLKTYVLDSIQIMGKTCVRYSIYANLLCRNKKNRTSSVRFQGWDREIRTPEMTGSEPVALPLGYIPTAMFIILKARDIARGNFKNFKISVFIP